ncbi:aspartate-semialdehyde dehydrogenase [Candidatus Arthromitus sp. SFB-mouse-Japan]|uniref:aspartate-semialdehyde dehydrogenase n=1 Tax=unclassified Candidatus Neoarthromitus TaxID=2638829 RepID=UPI00021B7EDB|nr:MULTISPECIES: aspartate-semialdehyde dehydrogenase [unclassified Candidatus Arthromitus]EIA23057.1 Aspartate-semialdehyde dehydrogenase [Candidatus Arthromitus sp. SFB-1]EIA24006.1 Aspartate-semialdehyde dehydrogenase [Candidatus Arthromitus sp. SFB-2]EIA27186.1 Aspartate-semialdehyde dehydrogenase [Candidatus Arthromitus sp. SFB-co]EIA30538.1 Aspartate-semialdehyde dehydrogenase [Candidatus Arthromitus sp. SFB-mouse-SU]EIA31525.1 Aspartate-semialdehyde dehydrogenase [Candidatus Arthromitus
MRYNVAVVGATGKIGRTFLKVLEERNFPVNNIYLYASKKSEGSKLNFKNKEYEVIELNRDNIKDDIDFAFFSAGSDTSLKFSHLFVQKNALVIDNSSAFRMDKNTPLVVPEVNGKEALKNNGIIANPNCSTIQAVVALKPLHDKFKIKRIIYSTYQAVSGAGNLGIKDLDVDIEVNLNKFQYLIKGNLIPQIDVFTDNGYTKEEMKMINETRKILQDESLKITATCVRVPIENSHSESINVEFENDFTLDDILNELKNFKGITLIDDIKKNKYPMPRYISGKDEVFVGRIRLDESCDKAINIWVVADNILKGAALNAVQIAEYILNNKGE